MERQVGFFAHSDDKILSFRLDILLGREGLDVAHRFIKSMAKQTGRHAIECMSLTCKLVTDFGVDAIDMESHMDDPKSLLEQMEHIRLIESSVA